MIDYMNEFVKNTNFNQNKPITEIVYESLRKTIISGIIPVGERIVEKEYAQRLNISRTPVREAIRRLEGEQLVENIPRVGVIVKRISTEDVIEIYKIRHYLEVLATRTAMEKITEEEIKAIQELLDLTEQKNKEGDITEVIRLFGEFNSLIYKASKMKRLESMISNLNQYNQKFRDISINDDARRERALSEHRKILKAIIDKDENGIDSIIKQHLDISLEVVYSIMKSGEENH
jgi:DNA-binding GntR family transcriptional regulator